MAVSSVGAFIAPTIPLPSSEGNPAPKTLEKERPDRSDSAKKHFLARQAAKEIIRLIKSGEVQEGNSHLVEIDGELFTVTLLEKYVIKVEQITSNRCSFFKYPPVASRAPFQEPL